MGFLESVPPLLQVLALALLGAYVAVSVAARLSPAFGSRVWDEDREPNSTEHLIEYTVIPALVLAAAVGVVVMGWDATRPWLGEWSGGKMTAVITLTVYGFAAVIGGTVLGKRIDISDARKLKSWLPLLLILSGLAALAGAVFMAA